jgi:hypothetical protein
MWFIKWMMQILLKMTPLLSMKESTQDQNKGLDNVTKVEVTDAQTKGAGEECMKSSGW